MIYVKVVTPLVLKRWVWPMIKCSHLTPKSIYSYIDDLVITNCLIDARVFVHTLSHISFAILLCEHAGCIFYSFEDIHLLFWLFRFFSFAKWMDKNAQELPLAIYAFLVSNSIHATSQSLIKSDSNHSVWGALGVPIRHRLKLQKPLCASRSDRFILFGPTKSPSWSRVFNLGATD